MAGWFVSGRNNRKLKREDGARQLFLEGKTSCFLSFSRSVIPKECSART